MGRQFIFWFWALWASSAASPRYPDESPFVRSAVETVPDHDPIAPPIRASVESVPLRSDYEEGGGRLPLRDAVEMRPIPVLDRESIYKFLKDAEMTPADVENMEEYKKYYGAASHFNNDSRTDEKLQQGNANLQTLVNDPYARRLVVCYVESWAAYRAPPLAFTASMVPKSCTHLHYAFAVLDPHDFAIIPANEDYDVVKGGYRIATGLKRRIQGLRVILSVGGAGTERLFSEMVQEPYRRNSFIDSAVQFLQDHDFDGLDLHWVYAGDRDEREKELLTTLLYELREKFSSYGFLLSTVLPPFRYQIEDGYDLSALSGATDYTILQAWDMNHVKRDDSPSKALQHSALHRDPGALARDQRFDNVEFMVKYVLRNGMAADKLVLGIPLFGRSYTLSASTLPSPGAAVDGWGDEGQYTQTKGMLAYFEICMIEREGRGASAVDAESNAYAVFDNQWISYDNPATVLEKMKFIKSNSLAGAAAWAIDMDDFRGLCGSPFPILSAISTSLNGEATLTDQSSLKVGTCESNTPYLSSDQESCAHFHFCTGGISFRMVCEDERLYDPSTGFCGHQDVGKCIPGQSLRITVEDAARFLAQAYESDFEWSSVAHKDTEYKETDRLITAYQAENRINKSNGKRVVCYMTSWAFYRRGDGKFVPEQIDTRLCTHVVYAYASLSHDDLIAKEFDPWADITNNLYERVTSLNDVKVLLGLGGWTDSAGDKYSRLVSSPAARTKFVDKIVAFLSMHNFKGLHLDWNYPVCWQSNCKKGAKSDKANFAKFVQELSKKLHSVNMELGVAISGYKEVIESGYDLPAISGAADFMSAMTYDYHGGWERTTSHHTPLTPLKKDALAFYSIEYAVKALISGGVDPKKLLLGLAFYGQSYRLADTEGSSGPGSPAAGPGEAGEFTKQPGMLSYYEICYRVKNLRWKTGRQTQAGPYAYSDNQWVGYDDPKSVTEKVEWALRQGLGGVAAWAIDLDDFNNRCCNEPSPLLRAAGRALGRSVPPPPTSPCERPPQPVTPAPPTTTPAESDGSVGGAADHGHHEHHTSTTWPSWNPSTTTQSTSQTWWSQPTTTPMTTTSKKPTTTTRRTTTSSTTTELPQVDNEGDTCEAGDYASAPRDCESYLQCEVGHWRKHCCAPGLHWSSKAKRCDWPSFAQCSVPSSSASSTTTTTLAPMTSRPPPRPTTRPTTTTSTTTTTTTAKTTTTDSDQGNLEGQSCNGQDYHEVLGHCDSYLHCDGSVWRLQRCAPGLHWSTAEKHCDWPRYAKCESTAVKPTTASAARPPTRPTKPPTTTTVASAGPSEGGACGGNDIHAPASTCDSYLLCVSGRWSKQLCPPGLHWDKRSNRCDWVQFAMCEVRRPEQTTKRPFQNLFSTTKKPQRTTARTTTRRPFTYSTARTTTKRPFTYSTARTTPKRPFTYSTARTTTRAPTTQSGQYQTPTRCSTGTYHGHPRCEKFYVCVNGALIAQSCAPGLVWNQHNSQCDFPRASSCTDRRQVTSSEIKPSAILNDEQPTYCESGQYANDPSDCTRYLHCLFGKFEEFACIAGLNWNQEKQICDWPNNAQCKVQKVTTTTTTMQPAEMEPQNTETLPTPPKPIIDLVEPGTKPELLNTRYKLVCYYTNWSWYRPGLGKFTPEDMDPSLCTHIVYGFAVLGDDGLIQAHDPWADTENHFYDKVVEFKKYGTKVSLAIGGWKDSVGDKYSKLVNDPQARAKFVRHTLEFIEKYNFDGLDLDWEYPKCWQVDCSLGPDSDKEGFANLVRELSSVFKPKGLLLSSAVSPSKMVIDAGYDVPVLAKYLDWIAVMTYDYHGQWDKKTGHVAPLYYHPDDDYTYFNANYTMHYWMEKGAPASKLVMGIPLYGQSFTTNSQWNNRVSNGLNLPAIGGGDAGEYTRAKGFLSYYEICERIKDRKWTVVKDPNQRIGPFAYKGNQWVSFDDIDIIKKKANFIKSLGLAGGMVWAIDLDDFKNRCNQGTYPLLNTIKNSLLDPNIDSELESENPLPEPQNNIDEDLEDIEVKPAHNRPAHNRPTHNQPAQTAATARPTTTKKPTTTAIVNDEKEEEEYKVVCYYTNWAWYRSSAGKFTPSDIDPSLCTHIVYAFAALDSTRLVIKPHDSWLDVENKFYEKVVALKSRGVKVVLGLGGWNDSAGGKYSRLVNNPGARRKFIVHVMDFLRQYGFEGLNLDWQFPKCWQVDCEKGPISDKQGFTALVKELRTAFVARGLVLSAAVSANKRVIDLAYDIPVLARNLDWISLMAYDYHGQWEKKTGHLAPMYANDMDDDETLNANFTVNYWLSKGTPRHKLILGVPFYGQSFSLVEDTDNGLGAPSYAGGEAGDETRARGFLSFYEICERIKVQGWRVVRDPGGRMGPYATLNDQWVSFDDDFIVRHKAEYVRAMELGGVMAWTLDLDDFRGQNCGCGKSPLLASINHVLRGQEAPPPCSLEEIQSPSAVATTTSDPEDVPALFDYESNNDNTPVDGSSLEGRSCSGVTFKEDNFDCAKYYLCINGQYIELTCPSPLVWSQNHCDFPDKSRCKGKTSLRITDGNEEIESEHKPIIACYFTNWAYYRKDNGSFGPEQVDPSLCSHIIYAWAHLDGASNTVVPGNPELDISNDFYGKITDYKLKGAKVIIGIGGIENSIDLMWSQVVADPIRRQTFVKSIVKFLQKWKFDGVQIAWQYPVCKETPCTDQDSNDKDNFSILIAELAKVLRRHNYELSAIVAPNPEIAEVAYDPSILTATLDWMIIAANDFYESDSRRTAYLLPLTSNGSYKTNTLQAIIDFWSSVVPARQLVMGLPAYGRSYTLRSDLNTGIGAPIVGLGKPGTFTRVPGFLAYHEICKEAKSEDWSVVSSMEGTYAVQGSQWVSYLRPYDIYSVSAVMSRTGLRGAGLWALDLDDWRGRCSCQPWPALDALRRGFLEPNMQTIQDFDCAI